MAKAPGTGLRVELLEHTPNPERSIALAARICYAPISAADLNQRMSKEEEGRLLEIILSSGHWSAVEHTSFTFSIEGVSRVCTHQLVRHRLASYNQQSQRYVRFENGLPVITPPSIARDPELRAKYEEHYQRSLELYKDFLEKGVLAEDARFLFPQGIETKLVMTMNARELMHFFTLRSCTRAQWEIRKLAIRMLKTCKELAPRLFAKAGPACFRQPCPEGKFYCGKPWIKQNEAPGYEELTVWRKSKEAISI